MTSVCMIKLYLLFTVQNSKTLRTTTIKKYDNFQKYKDTNQVRNGEHKNIVSRTEENGVQETNKAGRNEKQQRNSNINAR